jgi:hypothetical protein
VIKSKASYLPVTLIILFCFIASKALADRGIRVKEISDLTHGSEKLGEFNALIIGINDYKKC